MNKVFLSFFLFVLTIFSAHSQTSTSINTNNQFFPTITNLTSQNPVFKQYSQDVEQNYKNLATDKETSLLIYKYIPTKDDTLMSIAARCNISYDSIATLNRISSIHSNISGKTILLPTLPGLFIPKKSQNTIESLLLCRKFDKSEVLCYIINDEEFYFLENQKLIGTERIFFLNDNIRSPLPNGILSSEYGMRQSPISGKDLFHNGIDLAAELKTPVLSCLSGKILECGYNSTYGNFVVVLHDDNMKSFYAHLDSFACKQDDYVSTGQIIGYVGVTGLTTGPHLHFEIYVSGQTKDPWKLIN